MPILSCRDVYDLVTEYDEGALSSDERRRFEAHVVICPPCRGFLAQIRATRDALGYEAPPPEVPAELEESIVEAFRSWRREQ